MSGTVSTNKACYKKTNANGNPIKTLLDFKIVTCKSAASQVLGELCTELR